MNADRTAPRFEVGSIARTDDETYSPSQQAPDRDKEEKDRETLSAEAKASADEQPAAESTDELPTDTPASGTNINIVA